MHFKTCYSLWFYFQMSMLRPKIFKNTIIGSPGLPILTQVRFRGGRPDRHKLKKPEDKSGIILGKWKPSVAFPKPGVSDKAVSYRI